MRISDWSSDVCSSDLADVEVDDGGFLAGHGQAGGERSAGRRLADAAFAGSHNDYLSSQGPISTWLFLLYRTCGERSQPGDQQLFAFQPALQIGRASCRERVCQYV